MALPELLRSDVINSILSNFERPRYLEIGVNAGQTFLAVKADSKVAVDPRFAFDVDSVKLKQPNATFHAVTSDNYFGSIVNIEDRFDVIYLDGLHTFDQTLRDFINAIEFLAEGGVIVIDDVVPNSYHASLPDQSMARQLRTSLYPDSKDYSWMGDVYRLVFFISSFFQQFRWATVAENHGQLVVWRAQRPESDILQHSAASVAQLPFEFTITRRDIYRTKNLSEILALLQAR